MAIPQRWSSSLGFVTLLALLVALGAQALIEALTPIVAFDWIFGEARRQGPVVLVAGESLWREASLIRALAFGIGAFVACQYARSQSWRLLGSLVSVALIATVFAQFPMRASAWQLALWASSAPAAVAGVGLACRLLRGRT